MSRVRMDVPQRRVHIGGTIDHFPVPFDLSGNPAMLRVGVGHGATVASCRFASQGRIAASAVSPAAAEWDARLDRWER